MKEDKYFENINKKYEKEILKEEKSAQKELEKMDNFYNKEEERHAKIMESIQNAKDYNEVPNITLSSITSYLVTNAYIGDNKLTSDDFKPVIDTLVSNGGITNNEYTNSLKNVLISKYPDASTKEIDAVVYKITSSPRVSYMLDEIVARSERKDYFENMKIHEEYKDIAENISIAHSEKELPSTIGLGDVGKRIIRNFNNNSIKDDFKTEDIVSVRNAMLENKSYDSIVSIIRDTCKKFESDPEKLKDMIKDISISLFMDNKLYDLIDLYNSKENRRNDLQFQEHEAIMQKIDNALKIRQLPEIATVVSYLNGNTTIYSNDDRIKTDNLRNLANLLLNGKTFNDIEVKNEIKNITTKIYSDKNDAYDLLFNKLSNLPKLKYVIEEEKAYHKKEKECIENRNSDLYTYFVQDTKSSENGGKFIRMYLSSRKDLNLTEVASRFYDLTAFETYVKEHLDPTFAAVGAMILNMDEFYQLRDTSLNNGDPSKVADNTIIAVSFEHNDGREKVNETEKAKLDEINDLDIELNNKKAELEKINNQIMEVQVNAKETYDKVLEGWSLLLRSNARLIDTFNKSEDQDSKKRS